MKRTEPSKILPRADETMDEFMGGKIRLIQSKWGYRFSVDAVLLSEFVSTRKGDVVVDLGTGCGIILLILLLTRPIRHAVGVEIQADLAEQARRNALLNGYGQRMSVMVGDIRALPLPSQWADAVVCNPPYRPVASGRINPDRQRAIARHEILLSLEDILKASHRILRPGGRLALIYPSGRLAELLARMRIRGLEPKRIRLIHPDPEAEAKLVLVEASSGSRKGLKVLPPLFDQGDFSIAT